MQKGLFWISLSLILCISSSPALATTGEVDSIFSQANTFYQSKQYDQSIRLYNLLIQEHQLRSGDLFYNLGSAHLKKKDVANASLYLEKALKINPHNGDYQTNLELAKDLQLDDFGVIPDFFVNRWAHNISNLLSSTRWALLSILLFLITSGLVISWLFYKSYRIKKLLFYGAVIILFLSLLGVIFGTIRQKLELNNPYAIVMIEEDYIKMAPDDGSKEVVAIHAGLKVKVIDSLGSWSKIELSNKEVGWIPTNSIESI